MRQRRTLNSLNVYFGHRAVKKYPVLKSSFRRSDVVVNFTASLISFEAWAAHPALRDLLYHSGLLYTKVMQKFSRLVSSVAVRDAQKLSHFKFVVKLTRWVQE
jgi:PhoPQ-activated pathogenicity-related protein